MSYAPIAAIIPQYDEQDGYYLKFYIPSTTTPISMATDSTGATLLARCQLDNDGFPTTDGTQLFIPFINQAYDAYLFPSAALADANDTTNAKRVAQNILINKGLAKSFSSVADMIQAPLQDGDIAITSGFTQENIGGAKYSVKSNYAGTLNNGAIQLDNGNVAVLVHNGHVTIEQFGVTDVGTYSDELNDAINFNRVKKVTSSITSATFDKIAFIEKDNVTVDLSATLISYVGDYDVYAQFGISTDRSIGFINSRGVLGSNTTTVTSSIIDGTNIITVSDASNFSVNQYIQLNITYPRRVDEQVAKITNIDGNNITIDYTFGFIVTSCTITNIATMRQGNHVKLNLIDNSTATIDSHKIAGIGFEYSSNCSASWTVENHNFPAFIAYYCQDISISDGYGIKPKDITSGRGYNAQFNNSNRCNSTRLISRQCRHNWDSSGSSFCTVRDSHAYAPVDNIAQYTTHGIYEHDIEFNNNYHYDGQNAYTIAQSGVAFGSQNRRIKIIGGRCNGLIKSENAKQFTMDGVEFYGTQTAEHEFAGTEGTVVRNIKFNTAAQIRITVPSDITGTDALPSINDSIVFENVDFNQNNIRTTDLLGSVKFLRCKNFGILSDSDLVDYYTSMSFEECFLDTISGWEVKSANSLIIEDCEIDLDASLSMSAGNSAYMKGGKLTSSNTNIRLKFNAPVITVDSTIVENSVGIFAEANCKKFNLTNVNSINPDANHSSNQFTTEGTTNCSFIINGMNTSYTGSGQSILFVNTGLQAIIAGSYIEGNILFGGATATSFAGNITPDTVLP